MMPEKHTDLKDKLQHLYQQCRETLSQENMILFDEIDFENAEEFKFYMTLSELFLQEQQEELLKRKGQANGKQ